MAKFRNVSGEARFFPGVGLVEKDAVGECPDSALYSYTASSNCEPLNKADQALHDKAAKDEAERVAAEDALRAGTPGAE